MARKQGNFFKIAGIVSGVLAMFIVFAVGVYLLTGKGDSISKLPAFPIDSYINGANLWSYEAYKLEGRVDNVIFRSQKDNQLVASIQPAGSKLRLPVVIRKGAGMKPVQLEQQLLLKVAVGDSQVILCEEYMPKATR